MIPMDWLPVVRPDDGELVGYVSLDERGATPLTLFGYALAEPLDRSEAEELLRRRGLAVLADPWWLEPADGPGYRVQIMSATPDEVAVARADHGIVDPRAGVVRLPAPVPQLRPYAG